MNEILERLIEMRGVAGEERDNFFNPDYHKLHNPLDLPDMERARDRVIEAMEKGEHIVIFSDYDADGIPGAVVMSDFFKRAHYENISFYIPHRHDEGFGLNMDAVKECAERGAKLLITVDCGIADIEEVAFAVSLGMDVVVTDHHEQKETLPPAYAVVDPKRRDSTYPFKELCGSGVAFKLVQAILAKNRFGTKEGMEKWSLDMVGIATLSDVVPLVGENRILAKFGLDVLRKTPRPGLAALLRRLKIDQRYLTEDDIAFMITPRINAASRMGTPEDAFKLLSTNDPAEAEVLAAHLEKINNERKGVVASLVKDAKKHLQMREALGQVIVIGNPEWRPALLGLVANSLVEEYERPVFVWGRDGDGVLKGSCRSYDGYDLPSLMGTAEEAFIEYGGHSGAGGFSLTLESVVTLEDRLCQGISVVPRGEAKQAHECIVIPIEYVNEKLWQLVSQFAPFGTGNEKPVFSIECELRGTRQFGKENNHLELSLPNNLKAIAFFASLDSFKLAPSTSKVTIHGNLEKSYFRNRPELRLRIVDIISR